VGLNPEGIAVRAIITALMLTLATQAGAECGNLCDYDWWKTATTADLQAELDAGADIMARDKFGFTPVHWAASEGSVGQVKVLLSMGLNLMARNKIGRTPLHHAAGNPYNTHTPENIRALLSAGAGLMARDKYGSTPLHQAASGGTPSNVLILISAGADVMARDEDGRTPLHSAAACKLYCRPFRIQKLLAAGADAKAIDKQGKTPWDLASENGGNGFHEYLNDRDGYWALNDAQYK
jgi:ankyrin repeat protein